MQYLKPLALAIFISLSSFVFAQMPPNLTKKQQDLWQMFQLRKDSIKLQLEMHYQLQSLKKVGHTHQNMNKNII